MGVLYFLPQSEALERPSVTLRVAEWGIAARDIVCANYAYQSKRIYHLLAWQDTASGGMLHRAVERVAKRRESVRKQLSVVFSRA